MTLLLARRWCSRRAGIGEGRGRRRRMGVEEKREREKLSRGRSAKIKGRRPAEERGGRDGWSTKTAEGGRKAETVGYGTVSQLRFNKSS